MEALIKIDVVLNGVFTIKIVTRHWMFRAGFLTHKFKLEKDIFMDLQESKIGFQN
jgi:hypothetical protein